MKRYLAMAFIVGFAAVIYPAGAHAADDNVTTEEPGRIEALEEAAKEAVAEQGADVAAAEEAAPAFEVSRVVVAEAVVENEPTEATEVFPADADKAYVFLEATKIAEETEASFVWYRDGDEVARVALRLGQGPRWRTYSSKNINGLPGAWKVAVQDAGGNVVQTVAFSVE